MTEFLLRQSSVTIISKALIICQILGGRGGGGGAAMGGIPRLHCLLKPVLQILTFFTFFSPLFMVVSFEQMTIKHLMYMQKVPFLCTETACVVFFQFWDLP